MDLLLDTHVLVWMADGDPRLCSAVRSALGDPRTNALVSAVTAFEYADLQARGRFPRDVPLALILERFDLAVVPLPPDIWRIAALLPDLHRDPLDRMLVAHAVAADATVATADATIRDYPVRTLW